MVQKLTVLVLFFVAIVCMASSQSPETSRRRSQTVAVNSLGQLRQSVRALKAIQTPLEKPMAGDWLAQHKEAGQTFEQYIQLHPAPEPRELATLYIQPIGEFGTTQKRLVEATAKCLESFYARPVKTLPNIPLDSIPDSARRISPLTKKTQILTPYVLNTVLKPARPKDALAVLALSAEDLWPGKGWNYVFGQASLGDRVGVWSIQRFGDPDASPEAFQLCLERTLGTALHETGHMLGIPHCTAFQCGMNGSNSLEESDRGVLQFCAECQPKVWWACNVSPHQHLKHCIDMATTLKLADPADFWRKSLEVMTARD